MSKDSASPVSNSRKVPVGELAALHISASSTPVANNPKSHQTEEFNGSTRGLFFHEPEFIALPAEAKLKIIHDYHKHLHEKISLNQPKQIVFKYSDPIIPRKGKPFNDNLSVDWKNDDSDDEKEKHKVPDDGEQKNSFENDFFGSSGLTNTRPRRHVKRAVYTELLDSDDDDKPSPPKKVKSLDLDSTDDGIKWLHRSKLPSMNACDRTNKIFEALKNDDHNKTITGKAAAQKLVDSVGSSESEQEDDFYKKYSVSATVHKEQSPAPTSPSSSPLKLQKSTPKSVKPVSTRKLALRTRNANSKYSSVAKAVPSSSNLLDSPVMSTTSFYGDKTSDKFGEHNNNKTNKPEDMIECPICSQLFPKTEIEAHASKCDQFEDTRSTIRCEICNNSVPESELAVHKSICLQQLMEQSTVDESNSSTKSFLCEICERYLVNVNETEHASKCISSVGRIGKKLP